MTQLQSEHLRTFLAVIESGSLDAAATALRITPSAVSQRMKALEIDTGRVLLRRSKPAAATDAGQAVLRLARQFALLEHETLAELGADDDLAGEAAEVTEVPAAVRIPVAANGDSLATWLLPALAGVMSDIDTHTVVFDVRRDDQAHTAEMLRSGEVMAAITAESKAVPGCVSLPLGRMRYRAVASSDYVRRWLPEFLHYESSAGPASRVRALDPLRHAPVVLFDRSDELQFEFLAELFARAEADAHGQPSPNDAQPRPADAAPINPPAHYIPASHDFLEAIALGLGWGMLPEIQVAGHIARGELIVLDETPVDVGLWWQAWDLRSPLLDAVTAGIRRAAASALLAP